MKKTMTFAILAVFFQLSLSSGAMNGLQAADGFMADASGDFSGCYVALTGRVNFIYSETNSDILVGGDFRCTRINPSTFIGENVDNIVRITGDNDSENVGYLSFSGGEGVNSIMPWGSSNILLGGLFDFADEGITNLCRICKTVAGYWSLDTNFVPTANGA